MTHTNPLKIKLRQPPPKKSASAATTPAKESDHLRGPASYVAMGKVHGSLARAGRFSVLSEPRPQ